MTYKFYKNAHSVYTLNYHLVQCIKYRRRVLDFPEIIDELKMRTKSIAESYGCDVLAIETDLDHIHLFIGALPIHTPYKIVKQLKGNTSTQLRRCFKQLTVYGNQEYWGRQDNLWARGYYIGSAGHVSQDAVRRYIEEQQGKDVFEYNIFGDITGQTKIGDFS
jgi:putative transposase